MVDSPLDSGPVVGTSLHENIAEGYQRLGNVVQEPVKPGVTGEMVLRAGMARAKAMEALANGIDQGLSPLIDKMISSGKEAQAGADYAAGAQAGLAGTTGTGAGSVSGDQGGATDSQVTRSPSGALSILPSFSNLFGDGPSKAYAAGHVASENITTANSVAELGTKYAGDPEGFKGAWNAYMQGRNYGSLGPQYGTQATLNAVKYGDETYRNLLAKQTSAGLIASGHAVQTQIDSVSADMSALARGGKLDSPEYAQKQDQLQDLFGQLGENPSFDKASNNLEEKLNQKLHNDISDNVVGKVDSAYQSGGASAAQKMVGDAIDKVPGLSDTERAQFLQQGEARIRYNQGINRDQIEINTTNFKGVSQRINAGDRSPQASAALDGVIASAKSTGDYVTATQATNTKTALQAMPAGLSPSEVRGYRDNQGTGVGGGVGAFSAQTTAHDAAAIKSIEGGSYGGMGPVTRTGDRAYGAYQVMGANVPSWTTKYYGQQLTPQEFLGNKAAQDAVFQGEFGRLKAKYGGTGAAQAWFAGEGGMHNPGSHDSLGTTVGKYGAMYNEFTGAGTPLAPAQSAPSLSANEMPFTAEQIRTNPGLYTAYTDLAAGDIKNRTKAAETLGGSIETAISNHTLPAPESLAQYTQLAQDIPSEENRLAKVTGGAAALAEKDGGVGGGVGPGTVPSGGGEAYKQQVDAMLTGKGDLFKAGIAAAHDKMLDEEASFAKSHPIEYAARKGWAQQPPPINFGDPQSIAHGFAANAQITAAVARREPGVSLSAVQETLKPQVEAALVSADPQQAVNVLNGIAALPKDARDATIEDMSKAIVGATKSGDPVRMGAAYSLMDQQYRENPMTFDGKFGSGALSDLRKWQEIGQFQTTEKIAKDAMTADDPSTIKARDALKEYAKDKILNTVTGANVVDSLARTATAANPQSGFVNRYNPFGADYTPMSDAPGLVLGALKYDYDQNYKEQYAKTADQPTAEKYALERVGVKWGQSDANGGRFMAYPPERSQALPAIGGDKSWIGKQLWADVSAIHPDGKEALLVPDQQTQAEMTSGKVPSYQVATRGTDGSLYVLPKRWAPDPARAQTENAARYNAPAEFQGQPQPPAPWATGVSD